jgi:NAD(P)-dependent dehydrogenase (short-subunit alcohol dehydrogenase family)
MIKRILVVGASGDVGQGIVEAAANKGWTISAAGRDLRKLNIVASRFADGQVQAIRGSLASPGEADQLINEAKAGLGQIDAVVVSVNAPNVSRALVDWDTEDLISVFRSNLFTHFHSAKAVLTLLPPDAMLLGIGGGTADFVRADRAQISMAQAALRMMYRGLAKENPGRLIRQLQIAAMVNGESTRAQADESWLKDTEIGRYACAAIERPAEFSGPVIVLKSREQIAESNPVLTSS